ncbi:MAG: response regulator [Janthinobacterium lividum]
MRLLLVEDDAMIATSVADVLQRLGHAVDVAADGEAAELALAVDIYDLVVLDLTLPGLSGLDLLRRYRARGGAAPVLITTARSGVAERIAGLDAGADDYLVKPFNVDELAARVRALLRRRLGRSRPLLSHAGVELDAASREVRAEGAAVTLSIREFSLLQALLEEPTRVVPKAELEQKLYGWGREVESNAIEVHIHALRRKLGAQRIVTVRGVGYRLAALA